MANPSIHFNIHLHGHCLICVKPLTNDAGEIILLKRSGAFARFGSHGEMTVSDTSLIWLHAVHLV